MPTKAHSENRRLAPSGALPAGCLVVALVTHLVQSQVAAQALLYDNTDHEWSLPHSGPRNIKWVGPESAGDWFEAQPFKTGGHSSIASVSIPMARDKAETATGMIRVSLWDDDGRGVPGQEVGELGFIDVDSLPRYDFPGNQGGPNPPRILPPVTLNSTIDDLVPGATYYVFVDYTDLSQIKFGDVLVGLGNDPAGTNRTGGELYSKPFAKPPFEDSDWIPAARFFNPHKFLQMSVTSTDDPYAPIVCPVGSICHEDFTLGDDGQATTIMPRGWAFSDSARSKAFDGRDLTEEERIMRIDTRIFDTSITEAFPAGRSLGQGTSMFNAGTPGDADRALALGVTRSSEDAMLQLVTEVAGGDANLVQLQFDIEAWDVANSRDLPGEAAFKVALDLDTGDGFSQLLDLGTVSTGPTLLPSAVADFIDGNAPANRMSYDSGLRDVDLPEGSLLRVRWMADLDAETRGWVFGLDNVSLGMFADQPLVSLMAGDADQDLKFDQLDLVAVQVAAKYLTGQAATWGEGDWDGAPGGSPGNPPAGDGLFNQLDIIAAQLGAKYLTGPYAAVQAGGTIADGQTSVIYNTGTGEIAVDAPAGVELTSINIDSAAGIFTGQAVANLGGSFDNDADANIFKATFGSSFGSLSFGNVAQTGLSEEFMLGDLTIIGSLAGGGDLGNVDLVYVPEPTAALLAIIGAAIGLLRPRYAHGES